MAKLEATGLFSLASGRRRKPASMETKKDVALVMEKAAMEWAQDTFIRHAIVRPKDSQQNKTCLRTLTKQSSCKKPLLIQILAQMEVDEH